LIGRTAKIGNLSDPLKKLTRLGNIILVTAKAMNTSLYLFAMMALLGAFDTIYFHEWKAKLPLSRGAEVETDFPCEPRFHLRHFICFTASNCRQGSFAIVLVGLLLAELAITLADFVIEDRVRKVLGGVYPVERVTPCCNGFVIRRSAGNRCPGNTEMVEDAHGDNGRSFIDTIRASLCDDHHGIWR
jgi:hypothetical protein